MSPHEQSIAAFAIFSFVGIGVAVGPVAVSWLLWRHRKNTYPTKELLAPPVPDEIPRLTEEEYRVQRQEPYESGMPSLGPWRHIGYEYLVYAMLFLIFDILFVALFFSLPAWLQNPKTAAAVIFILMLIGGMLIWYGAKRRDYLRL